MKVDKYYSILAFARSILSAPFYFARTLLEWLSDPSIVIDDIKEEVDWLRAKISIFALVGFFAGFILISIRSDIVSYMLSIVILGFVNFIVYEKIIDIERYGTIGSYKTEIPKLVGIAITSAQTTIFIFGVILPMVRYM